MSASRASSYCTHLSNLALMGTDRLFRSWRELCVPAGTVGPGRINRSSHYSRHRLTTSDRQLEGMIGTFASTLTDDRS
jgi:hypothetical protein